MLCRVMALSTDFLLGYKCLEFLIYKACPGSDEDSVNNFLVYRLPQSLQQCAEMLRIKFINHFL